MPPKAARGASRGGRRTGKVNEATNGEAASSASAHAEVKVEENEAADSPSTTPAYTPADSPAPAATRPPVERLDTLAGRAGRSGTPARGAAAGAAAPRSRFKPRAIRRDVSERQKLEEEEKARLAGIEEKNAAIAARAAKSMRGRGGRGRGDAMGRGFGRVTSVASGPFAVAPSMPDRRPGANPFSVGIKRESGPGISSGDRAGGVSSFRTKAESGFQGGGSSGYTGEPRYPGEEDTPGARVDIEYINLVSSDDEDVQPGAKSARSKGRETPKGGLRPVRLPREEHKERVINLVTSDESGALPGVDGDVEELDMATINKKLQSKEIKPARVWKGVYDDDDVTEVKSEEAENGLHAIISAPSSPELKRVVKDAVDVPDVEEEEPPLPKIKRSKEKKPVQQKPVFQTEEDKAEYERKQVDLAILADELGHLQTTDASAKGKAPAAEGEMDIDTNEEAVDKKEGRLYLFQFPPVLPRLHNSDRDKSRDQTTTGEDVEMSGTSDPKTVDITADGEEIVIKEEPDVEQADDPLIPEEGYLGKMIVRESGKVEFDWGGNSMIVGRGFDASFLQTVVLTEFKEGDEEGAVTGMGSLMGKFVVTPDFGKIFESN